MTYKLFTILLGVAALILFALLKFLKGDVKIFVKQTNYYLFGTLVCFALVGISGWLIRTGDIGVVTLAWIFQLGCLGLGFLHVWLLFSVLPWANITIGRLEWLFTMLLMAVGTMGFFQSCIYFEKVGRKLDLAFADNILLGIVLFPVPLLCLKLWNIWKAIPRVGVTGWHLPLDTRPPIIEPGRSVKLSFFVHAGYATGQVIQIDVLAPAERTLGEMFHFILFRHNVEKNAYNKIELAENNSRSKAYSWLFFRRKPFLWFWNTKQYLNAEARISHLQFQNGDMIFVERVRHWLND